MTKLALVTGASRGLGHGMALALAPTHHIVAVGRTVGALEELDDAIKAQGGQATLAPMDICIDAAMQQLCTSIGERWGGLDVWVHTAVHATSLTPAHFVEAKDWNKAMEINATATQRLITYLHPLLAAREDAQALFFDDPVAGAKFFSVYGASKAAQMAIARSWQGETKNTGPKVHVVAPNPMPTATRARFHPGEDRNALSDPKEEATRLLATLGLASA